MTASGPPQSAPALPSLAAAEMNWSRPTGSHFSWRNVTPALDVVAAANNYLLPGADVNARTTRGETALGLAQRQAQDACAILHRLQPTWRSLVPRQTDRPAAMEDRRPGRRASQLSFDSFRSANENEPMKAVVYEAAAG